LQDQYQHQGGSQQSGRQFGYPWQQSQHDSGGGYGPEVQRPWRGQGWDGGQFGDMRSNMPRGGYGEPWREHDQGNYGTRYGGSYGSESRQPPWSGYERSGGEYGSSSGRGGFGYAGFAGQPYRDMYGGDTGRQYEPSEWDGRRYGSSGMGHSGGTGMMQSQGTRREYGSQGGSDGRRKRNRGPKGYTRSDERINEDLSDRLMQIDEIDSSDIEVKVNDGNVTLSGTVCDRQCKYEVEELADSIPGVKDVSNNLRIKRDNEDQNRSGGSEESSDSTERSHATAGSGRRSHSAR
jgi:hypothetical protein